MLVRIPRRGRRRAPSRAWAAAAALALGASPSAGALSVIGITPAPKSDAQRSCYELSAEITRLANERSGTAGFWSRTENRAAGVLVAVTPIPALGYLAYNAYRGYEQDRIAAAARVRIEELRHRLAERQCFVR